MLFDKICRHNGITHRLTEPESPNQNGKVERFHGTFRPELLEAAGPFDTVEAAQAAVDRWVVEYNTDRPHQALDDTLPVTPNDRFAPAPAQQQALVELWLPTVLQATPEPDERDSASSSAADLGDVPPVLPGARAWAGGAVEVDRVIPPSGNLGMAGRQLWLGPHRAGLTVTFWADTDVIHLLIAGTRVKTVRSGRRAVVSAAAADPPHKGPRAPVQSTPGHVLH